jgi:hypothetical protein
MADEWTSSLEMILDSDWAEMVVRNLLSYVLRDSTSNQGPIAHKSKSQRALVEAISIFADFKKLHPDSRLLTHPTYPSVL